ILQVAEVLELQLCDLMPLLFVAITGQASSVSVVDAMAHLGPDLTRYRLRQALELLGGASKKEVKAWEKLSQVRRGIGTFVRVPPERRPPEPLGPAGRG